MDDHPLFSRGLSSLITSQSGYTVCGEAGCSAEALELTAEKKPDLAIVDLRLGDEDGLEVIKKLKTLHPGLRILVLSMREERYFAERALKAGSNGYIMKTEAGTRVMEAIRTVLSGGTYISGAEQERLREFDDGGAGEKPFDSMKNLSNRQLRVFNMIGKGLGTLEIAAQLKISTKTVDAHKENLKLRLHCGNAQELRRLAIEWANK